MQIPKRRDEKLKVRDESPVYLTPEGVQKLKDKLTRLNASLANLATEARRTADYGDRSENAEYKEAKGKLRGAHREILRITDQLKRAVPIKPTATGKVQLGSTVVLEIVTQSLREASRDAAILPKGSRKEFQIVGPNETDPDKGRISFKSPLGEALMDHIVGDTITIKSPSGLMNYRILEIK